MSFPSSPLDGQVEIVNNIKYAYKASANAWYRLAVSTVTSIVSEYVQVIGSTDSYSTNTGALLVGGGAGVVGNLYVGGTITAEGGFSGLNASRIFQNTSSVAVSDTGSISQVVVTIADTTNTTFSPGLVDINADLDVNSVRWKNSTTNAVSVYQVYNHVTQSLDTIFV
jgi:hypothetical protein